VKHPLLGNGSANTPIVRPWLIIRHMTAVKLTYTTIEELLEAAFSVRSVPRLYNGDVPLVLASAVFLGS
jgi:hypothetical protein